MNSIHMIYTDQVHLYNSYGSSSSICEKSAYGLSLSQKKQLKKEQPARDILDINKKC